MRGQEAKKWSNERKMGVEDCTRPMEGKVEIGPLHRGDPSLRGVYACYSELLATIAKCG